MDIKWKNISFEDISINQVSAEDISAEDSSKIGILITSVPEDTKEMLHPFDFVCWKCTSGQSSKGYFSNVYLIKEYFV